MSDSPSDDLHETASADGPGILAALPRTRPQRASARRTAARAATPSAASAASSRQARATPSRPTSKRASASTRATGTGQKRTPRTKGTPDKISASARARASATNNAAAQERAPRQGFEAEPDSLGPVQPPGSTELISSAAELAGELARAGVTTGARVLRDFLTRLPG